MSQLSQRPAAPEAGRAVPHESARAHVTGQALYTDDISQRTANALTAWPVQSPHAHARVRSINATAAFAVLGVVRVLTAADVPGVNDCGIKDDEPLFPSVAMFHGHAVAWVLAEDPPAARAGAAAVEVDWEPLPSLVSMAEAIAAGSFQGVARTVRRGDAGAALKSAHLVVSGVTECSGQEHFYLETQASLATVDEGGQIFIHSSTQHPSETQEILGRVLGRASHGITVQSLRMGGGFGGKEMQSHGFAAVAAIGTLLTGRPVRVRLNRTLDMTMTGKRHGFHTTWEAGFAPDGTLLALKALLTSDGGWCLDMSEAVMARALCHIDNAYFIANVEARGRIALSNKTSQTAFRGFGGPQGMLLIEDILGRSAPLLGLAPEELRRKNFYREGQATPYGMPVRDAQRIATMWEQLLERSDFAGRRRKVDAFNAAHPDSKRGLAITPVKFGISFNLIALNQAGALVHVYKDGSVLINHGGTEMGQGLHTKMLQVAATALGIPLSAVRLAPTRTDKVPNTSATAASSGSDLNGGAVKNACEQILARISPVAGGMLGVPSHDVRFSNGLVTGLGVPDKRCSFAEVARNAYLQRVQLWAAGYYRTEGLHWNPEAMAGEPFKYFAGGAAVAEVEVDGHTGSYTQHRVDIIHDAGDSLSPMVDIGQIEGGYVQGVGWLTLEDLRWDEGTGPGRGRLLTQSASTYKLPSFSEMPEVFNVHLLDHASEEGAVYGSKAVGEPPVMLAFAAREALRDAVAAFGPGGRSTTLASPATPEAVFWAIQDSRGAAATTTAASPAAATPAATTIAAGP